MLRMSSVRLCRTVSSIPLILMIMMLGFGCDSDPESTVPEPDMGAMDMDAPATDGSVTQSDASVLVDMSPPDVDVGQMSPDMAVEDAELVADASVDMAEMIDAELPDFMLPDAEPPEPSCVPPVSMLQFSVWPQVFDNNCTDCHLENGIADNAGASFILRDPSLPGRFERPEHIHAENLEMIMAFRDDASGAPYLIPKASATHVNGHGGGPKIDLDGPEAALLEELFEQYDLFQMDVCEDTHEDSLSYQQVVERVVVRDAEETYRSFTVQTLGRLPTNSELRTIRSASGSIPMLGPNQRDNQPMDMRRMDTGATLTSADSKNKTNAVRYLIDQAARTPAFRKWIKDQWNDVFMFRGVYVQDLDRVMDVFSPHDFGARSWVDLGGIKVPPTDENGEFLDEPGFQMLCELIHDRFDYPAIANPPMTPIEACLDGQFSRHGIAYWMMYGAIEEPLELIASIIQERRPFTEIVTSDEVMMNYYSSVAYFGSADPALNPFTARMNDVPYHEQLKNGPTFVKFDVSMPDHRVFKPFQEMKRTRLNPNARPNFENTEHNARELTYHDREDFPRAGILSSAAFMKRFPGSELNMQRHRAWQAMRLLLDYDILLNQGDRLSIADVAEPNSGVTMSNPDCASCHELLDPVAGLFRDFAHGGNSYSAGTADNRWSRNVHEPSSGGLGASATAVPHDRDLHGPPIQYLGQLIAEDPRFAKTMVHYAWKQVMGSEPIDVASNLEGADFDARTTLILAQERFIQGLIEGFVRRNHDLMWVYRQIFTSIWYQAKGLTTVADNSISDEVYEGVGRYGTLTPEEYFRRLEAVFGGPWPLNALASDNRLQGNEHKLKADFFTRTNSKANQFDLMFEMIDENFAAFFGGVDFQNNLTRAEQMNSVMSLVARRVANEFACLAVYADLVRAPDERTLFYSLSSSPSDRMETTDAELRTVLVDLYEIFLAKKLAEDHEEITAAADLWTAVRNAIVDDPDNSARRLPDHCVAHESIARGQQVTEVGDPSGRIQAWMAVVSYLMMQPEFIQR